MSAGAVATEVAAPYCRDLSRFYWRTSPNWACLFVPGPKAAVAAVQGLSWFGPQSVAARLVRASQLARGLAHGKLLWPVDAEQTQTLLGRQLLKRQDAAAKLTGEAIYAADVQLPGMLHAKLLFPAVPFARIKRIDTSAAKRLLGVHAVVTQADMPALLHGGLIADRTLFADKIVRFEGEIIAAVAAESPRIAAEACALIEVDYEPLEQVLDAEAALSPDAPLVHPRWEEYDAHDDVIRAGNSCAYVNIINGDVEEGFGEADVVVEGRYRTDLSHPVAIEPHAVIAQWQGPHVTIWSSSQVPYAARAAVAKTLQMSEGNVRVIVPHLGGGFGGKCEAHFEPHVAALARAATRPVRLVLTRRETFIASDMNRHPITMEFKTGVRRDGTLTAHSARLVLDTGAYAGHGPTIAECATLTAAGPYRVPNVRIEAHAVYTSRTPAGSTRAPSGPQVCWGLEQHMDILAERIGLDPVELRRRNIVGPGDHGPTGAVLTSVGAKECLDRALELMAVDDELPDDEAIGVACGAWQGGMHFPSDCTMRMNLDGTASLGTGAQENGSGAVMGLAILAAEQLGLEPEDVTVQYQDTTLASYDAGSLGSQTTFNNGRAVVAAAEKIATRLKELAADELEASPVDMRLSRGRVHLAGDHTSGVAIKDVVGRARVAGEVIATHAAPPPPLMPANFGGSCAGRVVFPATSPPSFFCHAARVRVDRETGVVRIRKVVACHDVGKVLNILGANGQVEGGVAHALGMAISEGVQTGTDGRQRETHLTDYKLLTSTDVPEVVVEFVEPAGLPEDGGPHGSKGVGEVPVMGTAAAVANAIANAVGVRVRQLPMTAERVWAAMQEQDSA
jgi:CO/xanthine dehydrogenase Mo-binding subunit